MKKILLLTTLSILCLGAHAQEPVFGRAPLATTSFAELPIGDIHPEGWLLTQLESMRDGMTGHMDELYEEVLGDNNAWLGGVGDTWERGPYWVDGLLPLAYILKDETLIAKSRKWVEAILASRTEEGYFGNSTDNPGIPNLMTGLAKDWWPRMVVLKILKQHYMATGDTRVVSLMTDYFRYQAAHLGNEPLGHWTFWGEWRGGDNLDTVLWLYDLTGDKFLLDLAETIHSQTIDWTGMFSNPETFVHTNTIHCVNLAHGFKEPLLYWRLSKDSRHLEAPEKGLASIRHTIALPTGLWGGDELIQMGEPTRGSELCTAVEMMFSLEEMMKVSGGVKWADLLERVTYNALPTQITDDFDAHQYYQTTNQISCRKIHGGFSTPHEDTDVLFGILNGYPCCACNLHQGWPKFVQNLWYASPDGGLAALAYGPCSVETTIQGGLRVKLEESGNYPFGSNITVKVSLPGKKRGRAAFPLHFRIPSWCEGASICVNGKLHDSPSGGSVVRILRQWKDGDTVTIDLPMKVRTDSWYGGALCVERGPLLYALKMNEHWEKKEFTGHDTKYGPFYYEVTSDSKWNYGLSRASLETPEETFVVNESPAGDMPWSVSSAPVTIKAKAVEIKGWEEYRGTAGPVAYYSQDAGDSGAMETVQLIPYGCTTLRIAMFPSRP